MSSSVCQGLQSCMDLRHIESRFMRLKLAPQETNFPASSIASTEPKPMPFTGVKDAIACTNDCKPIGNRNVDTGCWSFVKSPADNTEDSNSTPNDEVYVHPLVKRSTSMLSERSLEMCTESLGSETGSDVSESIDDISLLSLENVVYNSKPRESSAARMKTSRVKSFPPPLTSISGSNGVKVKSRREGGRLVLEAVTSPPCNSYFHTERSEGRLRLSLFKDIDANAMFEGNHDEEKDQEEVKHDEYDGEDNENGEINNEESLIMEVRIWNEIVGVLGPKSETEVKKVGVGTKGCLIGTHCWWGDYLKAKSWKISLNPTRENYYYWIP
ncbi:protein FANTASTIC FOUR 2-like [Hibiscus syriacus]|uniref:protein FANTASTIC FOUR 2-like n=1 Tax=Hibiscus syriacus TaxID=106335 RepID=UPI001923BA40|nr:protein FANTASTIC FOUR 2-like [Hibiscus syriacus]